MDREWTYRPPVLVGERVVWLGGSAGIGETEPCDYGPHHGIVSWIGRVPDMGPSWTVGVDFETDLTGGCDGAWKGRHIFTCQPGHGLFLPVSSLIKDEEFYGKKLFSTSSAAQNHIKAPLQSITTSGTSLNMDKPQTNLDISLAPEPPPPKVRSSAAPSYEIHTRNYLENSRPGMDPSEYSAALGGVGRHYDKRQTKSTLNQSKDKGSSSFSTSVVTTSVSSSVSATTSTTIYSSSVCSSTAYTSKEMMSGTFSHKEPQDTSQNSRNVRKGATSKPASAQPDYTEANSVGSEYEEFPESNAGYYGETMVRKSSLSSNASARELSYRLGQNRQSSVSTPSSPNLSDYQRNYGAKSSVGMHSSMLDIGKKSSSLSGHLQSGKPQLHREKSGGFLNIFRWFRNRDRKKRSTSVDRVSTNSGGSVSSLTSATSSFAYIPIMRSKSADNNKKMAFKRGPEFGVSGRLLSEELSPGRITRRDDDLSKRLSTISASSDGSSKGGSRSTTVSRKKRPAPQPPGSSKNSDSGSLKSHKSCTSLPTRDTKVSVADSSSPDIGIPGQEGRKLQKSKSEGLIYTRNKRRAPLPPAHLVEERARALNSSEGNPKEPRELPKKRQAPAVPAKRGNRPISNISSISSISQSPSSASTTLKSHSSSITSSETASSLYSTESFRLESGYLKQELKSSSSPSIPEATKMNLSPRPWYKRKKKQNKEATTKDLKDYVKREKVYESWMPDIQFSRSKLSLSGSFRLGRSMDEETLKKSKEDEKKEKRKSQVSLLANISELDRAASEQLQREMEEKRARKELYDSKFYKTSEPHMLTQTDFLPGGSDLSDTSTMSSACTNATLKSSGSKKESGESANSGVYDTLHATPSDMGEHYTEQTTLKLEKSRGISNDGTIASTSKAVNSDQGCGHPKFDTSDSDSPPVPPVRPARESPLQRASFDAELFYKLAKDTQGTSAGKLKSSPSLSSGKDLKRQHSDEEAEHAHESILSQFRRQSKNFGLRMNNFFSPDVSTIIEASESMTSSATTPADDIYDDLPVPSSICERGRRDSTLEELHSEINYDLRLNTSEAREIMKELADVRQEIARINQEEEEATRQKEKKKADRIREEVLLLREKDNFEQWKNVIKNTSEALDENTPIPVDVEYNERKLKWICEMCTLINLPWRLQCEACMMRRPLNPRRIEEDNKSGTDHLSSQPTASDESPITVIHEGENAEDAKGNGTPDGDAASSGEVQVSGTESQPADDKKRRDINWERELRKYFMTFDEHVRGASPAADGVQSRSSNKNVSAQPLNDCDSPYGKISKSSRMQKLSQEYDMNITGTKPKSVVQSFDGTRSDMAENGQLNGSSNFKDNEAEPNLDELRKARTAKFMSGALASNAIEVNGTCAGEITSTERKTTKKKRLGSKGKKSKSLDDKYYKEPNEQGAVSQTLTNGISGDTNHLQHEPNNSHSSAVNGDNSEDKTFYNKDYRKPQVRKPSGVVNSVVSIFNQLDQLQHVKEKPKVTRRSSFSNVMGRTQAFEQFNSQNNSPELPRNQKTFKESPSFPKKNDLMKGKDIVAAIAKFDEMAAMAEVEKIEKQRKKNEASRRKPKFSNMFTNKNQPNKSSSTGNILGTIDDNSNSSASGKQPANNSKQGIHSINNSSGIVREGVFSTENRNRSVSVGSGTFELIQAKDFESIEAQHSECSSPLEPKSVASTLLSTSDSQSSAVVPQIVIEPVQDQASHSPISNGNNIFTTHNMQNGKDEHTQVEKQEVERLKQQLTVADGIANFKATLKVEEPNLGQMNTLSINRLLRRLEAAISCGKHAEAAKLAHELAELRVSCSVIRNPKDKSKTEIKATSATSPRPPGADSSTHLNPLGSEAEALRAVSPNSNMSECFYDAYEKLENEQYEDHYSQMVTANGDHTSIHGNQPKQVISQGASNIKEETRVMPVSSQSFSDRGTTVSNNQKANSHLTGSKDTSETTIRETKIDPARREVKSDTISKFPDGLPDVKEEVHSANSPFNVKMYVEDKNSHQGPITVSVRASMTVGKLREKVYHDFGFPPEFQRWILGRRLAEDDSLTLSHHKVTVEGCPIFLYLVAPEPEPKFHSKSLSPETNYVKYSSDQSLRADGNTSHDHEVVYSVEGEKHKFYNPDTNTYEVSVDADYSDLNGDDDDEDEDDYNDEDSTDNEDTLNANGNDMYQNHNGIENVSQENTSGHDHPLYEDQYGDKELSKDLHDLEKPSSSLAKRNENSVQPTSSVADNLYYDTSYKVYEVKPVYSNVNEKARESESLYQQQGYGDSLTSPLPQQQSEIEQTQEQQNVSEARGESSTKQTVMTPELTQQKRLIMELKHQQHYAKVPLVRQVAPEAHSLQAITQNPGEQTISQGINKMPQAEESYYNFQGKNKTSQAEESYYNLQQNISGKSKVQDQSDNKQSDNQTTNKMPQAEESYYNFQGTKNNTPQAEESYYNLQQNISVKSKVQDQSDNKQSDNQTTNKMPQGEESYYNFQGKNKTPQAEESYYNLQSKNETPQAEESYYNLQGKNKTPQAEESYYNLQQNISVKSSVQDQSDNQQQVGLASDKVSHSKALPLATANKQPLVTQEKPIQIPTPNRSSSLKLQKTVVQINQSQQQKVAQLNQSQRLPDLGQMKSIKEEHTSQVMPSFASTSSSQASGNLNPQLQSPPLNLSPGQRAQVPEKAQQHNLVPQNPSSNQQQIKQKTELPAKQFENSINKPQTSLGLPDKTTAKPQISVGGPEKDQKPSENQEPTLALPSKTHGWVCPSCTLVNKWERSGCEACTTERPGIGSANDNTSKVSGISAAMSALERQGYVPNQEPFECRVCFLDIGIGEGAVLRDCLHMFCRDCLSNTIKFSDTAEVKCPYRDDQYSCDSSLQDREIKALLTPKEYEKHLNKSVKQAEGAMQNVFHCKTPDCLGFCQFEDNVNLFHCDVCERTNCLTCQAQHEGKTCQEYQDDLKQKVDEAAMKTKKFFDDMIRRGDGLPCPKCSVMLVRKWGCDWMRCPMCRTEICWVTRGPRWGPGGAGDVSGGCKCGVRGQKCHPKCTYCH